MNSTHRSDSSLDLSQKNLADIHTEILQNTYFLLKAVISRCELNCVVALKSDIGTENDKKKNHSGQCFYFKILNAPV